MDAERNCLFCKICRREISARIVDDSEGIVAFHDVNPMAPVHILIVPKAHVSSVNELDETNAALVSEMTLRAARLAASLNLSDSGYRLVMNTGSEAGQSVFHLHMHLLGGRPMTWPPG